MSFWVGFAQGLENISQRKQEKDIQKADIAERQRAEKSDQDFRMKMFQMQAANNLAVARARAGASRAKAEKEAQVISGKARAMMKVLGPEALKTERGQMLLANPPALASMYDVYDDRREEFGKKGFGLTGIDLMEAIEVDLETGFAYANEELMKLPVEGALDPAREVAEQAFGDQVLDWLDNNKDDIDQWSVVNTLWEQARGGSDLARRQLQRMPQFSYSAPEVDTPFLDTQPDPLFAQTDEVIVEPESGPTEEEIEVIMSILDDPESSEEEIMQATQILQEYGYLE